MPDREGMASNQNGAIDSRLKGTILAAILATGDDDQVDRPLHQPGGSLAGNDASPQSSTQS